MDYIHRSLIGHCSIANLMNLNHKNAQYKTTLVLYNFVNILKRILQKEYQIVIFCNQINNLRNMTK